jgi:hypothetical protein
MKMGIIPLQADPVVASTATAANVLSIFVGVSVLLVVGMTFWTVSFLPMNVAPAMSTSDIFGVCNGFQVIRIDATPYSTQMIKLQPLRNRTLVPLIAYDMG